MANSFSASFAEIWAKEQQTVFYKTNVAMKIADTSFDDTLKRGDTLNRTYRSSNAVQSYTRGTAITIDDKTDTNEQLVVNKQYANGFYVDDFDAIQNSYDAAVNYWKDNGIYLSNQVDSDVLWEVFNATNTVDDGTIGWTSGNSITLSTSNILKVVSAAKKKLRLQNVSTNNLYWVVSPDFVDILTQYGAGRDTKMGDTMNENGFVSNFYGFMLYESNQTAWSAILSLATQPTNGDTVVIEWQTFTFVSSIWSTAGNVLIGANVDVTRASLAAFLNDPNTTSATQVALTANSDNARLFTANVSATNDNTADTLLVKYKGVGVLTVSETLTDATDTWTTTKIKQHCLFGAVGNPVLVTQRSPSVVIKDVPDKLGKNILNGVLYGVKTFTDNAKAMVNVELNAANFG